MSLSETFHDLLPQFYSSAEGSRSDILIQLSLLFKNPSAFSQSIEIIQNTSDPKDAFWALICIQMWISDSKFCQSNPSYLNEIMDICQKSLSKPIFISNFSLVNKLLRVMATTCLFSNDLFSRVLIGCDDFPPLKDNFQIIFFRYFLELNKEEEDKYYQTCFEGEESCDRNSYQNLKEPIFQLMLRSDLTLDWFNLLSILIKSISTLLPLQEDDESFFPLFIPFLQKIQAKIDQEEVWMNFINFALEVFTIEIISNPVDQEFFKNLMQMLIQIFESFIAPTLGILITAKSTNTPIDEDQYVLYANKGSLIWSQILDFTESFYMNDLSFTETVFSTFGSNLPLFCNFPIEFQSLIEIAAQKFTNIETESPEFHPFSIELMSVAMEMIENGTRYVTMPEFSQIFFIPTETHFSLYSTSFIKRDIEFFNSYLQSISVSDLNKFSSILYAISASYFEICKYFANDICSKLVSLAESGSELPYTAPFFIKSCAEYLPQFAHPLISLINKISSSPLYNQTIAILSSLSPEKFTKESIDIATSSLVSLSSNLIYDIDVFQQIAYAITANINLLGCRLWIIENGKNQEILQQYSNESVYPLLQNSLNEADSISVRESCLTTLSKIGEIMMQIVDQIQEKETESFLNNLINFLQPIFDNSEETQAYKDSLLRYEVSNRKSEVRPCFTCDLVISFKSQLFVQIFQKLTDGNYDFRTRLIIEKLVISAINHGWVLTPEAIAVVYAYLEKGFTISIQYLQQKLEIQEPSVISPVMIREMNLNSISEMSYSPSISEFDFTILTAICEYNQEPPSIVFEYIKSDFCRRNVIIHSTVDKFLATLIRTTNGMALSVFSRDFLLSRIISKHSQNALDIVFELLMLNNDAVNEDASLYLSNAIILSFNLSDNLYVVVSLMKIFAAASQIHHLNISLVMETCLQQVHLDMGPDDVQKVLQILDLRYNQNQSFDNEVFQVLRFTLCHIRICYK